MFPRIQLLFDAVLDSFLVSFFTALSLSFSGAAPSSPLLRDDLLLERCSPLNSPLMPLDLGAFSAPSLKWCPPFGVAVASPIPSTWPGRGDV
jgi:hypothetical protein